MSSVPGAIVTATSIEVLFDEIVSLSRAYARSYRENLPELLQMRADSPYRAVVVAICMDERCCSFSHDTGGLPGYYDFMRTKGARLELSNHQVSDSIHDIFRRKSHQPVLMIFTVHFSDSDFACGCAGWNSNTSAAYEHQHRVAEAFRRSYPGAIHTVVLGIDTDTGSLVLDCSDHRLSVADIADEISVETSVEELMGQLTLSLEEIAAEEICAVGDFRFDFRTEIKRMFSANARFVYEQMYLDTARPILRRVDHSATRLYAGSGFEFISEPGEAVHVGLHSSTFIADVALGIEKIIIPGAARSNQPAILVVNREYDPKLPGELDQARDWVHAVIEDIACLFKSEIDSGELRMMESVSTLVEGMIPVITY
ncbi:MAG: hypothetical protein CMI52_03710 [Parcubacteria group bacterium]|nr:hypothetical protein [Parcubacteria group bacterium]